MVRRTAVAMSVAGYRPRPYKKTRIPSAPTLHALERFSCGWTPALQQQVEKAGGFAKWFEKQLAGGYSDTWYATSSKWWLSVNASDATVWKRAQDDVEGLWVVDANYQRWAMMRRIRSQRQVQEVLAEFWEHHFHVPAVGEVGPFRTAYGKAIRARALGSFENLLTTAVLHPAMQTYLDNANSSKSGPNENLARELLELHTVGRGNYGETDVKNSARILTGYRIGIWDDWKFSYDPGEHWTGPVTVMGFHHANAAADGRAVARAYLTYLAHHPTTAERIARKLAVRFVSDNPSTALVKKLAAVYLANKTQIKPVLRAILASTEFKRAHGKKVRTPSEDVVATYRALGVTVQAPRTSSDESAANQMLWQTEALGMTPFGWPRPDGRPDDGASWSSTSRFLASLDVHYSMCGGWWPTSRIGYRKPAAWLPQKSIRFDQWVDHLSRRLLGRGSTALLLEAACQAVDCRPATVITASHDVVKWSMARLLTVFLDSPSHMTR